MRVFTVRFFLVTVHGPGDTHGAAVDWSGPQRKPMFRPGGGAATAWVRNYRPDSPGSGYVQLWAFGATADRLPVIRAVAEYGLLRPATVKD
jgi:hypothetical protein